MISSVMDTLNLAPNLEVIKQILNELVDGNERLLSRLSNGEKVSCLVKELFSPKLDMNAFKSFRRRTIEGPFSRTNLDIFDHFIKKN